MQIPCFAFLIFSGFCLMFNLAKISLCGIIWFILGELQQIPEYLAAWLFFHTYMLFTTSKPSLARLDYLFHPSWKRYFEKLEMHASGQFNVPTLGTLIIFQLFGLNFEFFLGWCVFESSAELFVVLPAFPPCRIGFSASWRFWSWWCGFVLRAPTSSMRLVLSCVFSGTLGTKEELTGLGQSFGLELDVFKLKWFG